MKTRSTATTGASLVLVVLFTMLLLAGILAATMRLSLGSRQNTADQRTLLVAQYSAESGMSLAQSRLQDLQSLLSTSSPVDDSDNFEIPASTTPAGLKTHAENLCGKTGTAAWVETTEFATSRSESDPKTYPNAKQCTIDANSIFSGERSSALADFLKQSAYAVLPTAERPTPVTDRTARLSWWNTLLSNTDKTVGNAKYRMTPSRIVQLTDTNYRFYLKVSNVRTQGAVDGATRVLSANQVQGSEWWFEIVLPSLLDDVLMTNHHRAKVTSNYNPAGAPAVNFDDQIFDGSIHTNEKFLFTNTSSAQFKGNISSVGCNNLPQSGLPSGGDCTKQVGVYIGGSSGLNTPPSGSNADQWLANKVAESPRTVQFVKKGTPPTIDYSTTDFTASYKPLPLNENDQKTAGTTEKGGLTLGGSNTGVELVAGDTSGNPLTEYDTSTKKWKESGTTYQYVRFLKSQTVRTCDSRGRNCVNVTSQIVDTDNEYRYGADKMLYKKDVAGIWRSQGQTFNGVIYGSSMQSVRGPGRKDGSASNGNLNNVPPAVASFAGLTLAATGDIDIDSDLTLSDTPCTYSETKATPPCTKRPTNILGVYSQDGDIVLTNKNGRDMNLHAAILASEGQVTVEDYDTRADQGNVNLIGSMIENWYGPFGKVGNPGKGYGRNFTYDQRLREGTVPPFFPVSPRWQAEDANLTGRSMSNMIWRQTNTRDY